MSRYIVRLVDRKLWVLRDVTPLKFPSRKDFREYTSAQEAADAALDLLAPELNVRDASEVAARMGDLSLALEGHERELGVVLLHWHIAWGAPREALSRIGTSAIDRGPSIYESFEFGSYSPKLAAVRELLAQWTQLAQKRRIVEAKGDPWKDDRKVFAERPRVGIVGVTGAGKSMFINALLRTPLLSSSSGNSTGCITELAYTDNPTGSLMVILKRRDLLEQEIRTFDGVDGKAQVIRKAKNVAMTPIGGGEGVFDRAEYDRRKRRIDGLREASKLDEAKQYPLSRLEEFTNAEMCPTVFGIDRVTVSLRHPLLKHVTLVDTPGTQDPDEHRRWLAIAEAKNLHAWVYLVAAYHAPTDTVVKEWDTFRTKANNRSAAMILTMADQLVSKGEGMRSVLVQRAQAYRALGWRDHDDIESSAALPMMDLLETKRPNEAWVDAIVGYLRSEGRRGKVRERLQAMVDEGEVSLVRFVDYTSDLCGLVRSATLMARVGQRALLGRVDEVHQRLGRRVVQATATLNEELATLRRDLARCNDVAGLEALVAQDQRECADAKAKAKWLGEVMAKTRIAADSRMVTHGGEVRSRANDIKPSREVHDAWVDKHGRKHLMYGTCQYDLLDEYDGPVAKFAGERIECFARATCDGYATLLTAQEGRERLRKRTEEKLQGYSLVPSPSRHTVDEREELFEWRRDALGRLWGRTLQECDVSAAAIVSNMKGRMAEVVDSLEEVVRDEALAPLQMRIQRLSSQVEERSERLRELKLGLEADPVVIEQRINEVNEVIDEAAALQARLLGVSN